MPELFITSEPIPYGLAFRISVLPANEEGQVASSRVAYSFFEMPDEQVDNVYASIADEVRKLALETLRLWDRSRRG